jgi:hypothetical protein
MITRCRLKQIGELSCDRLELVVRQIGTCNMGLFPILEVVVS